MRRDRPGYLERRRDGRPPLRYWSAQRAHKGAPKQPLRPIPEDADDTEATRLCQQWTDELLADLHAQIAPAFDGTIRSLIRIYRTDEASPYHDLKYLTRAKDYDPALRMLDEQVGLRAISLLDGSDFRRWYQVWSKGGVRRAHGAMRKLRTVLSFGITKRLPGCKDAREILAEMRFAAPRPRDERMTYEQAQAIIEKAMELGSPSVALATAMQFDLALRRVHVIGEWMPAGDAKGGIVRGKTRWRGPTVADIKDGVYRPPYAEHGKAAVSHDITVAPLVQMVLSRHPLPATGPLIVREDTGVPWRDNYYAYRFREIARAAGVPDSVRSMDARAGAITEVEAVAGLDSARKYAGHSSAKTTQGYVRDEGLDERRRTALARQQARSVKPR